MNNWEKLGEQLAYKGYRNIIRKTFLLPGGKQSDYDIVDAPSYVAVVAVTSENEFILVKQYRPAPEAVMIHVPSGFIDKGEEPIDAAKRELLEETGYEATKLTFLKKIQEPYSHVAAWVFLAEGCLKVSDPEWDEEEFLEIFCLDEAAFREFISNSKDVSFDGIAAAYLALDHLNLLS